MILQSCLDDFTHHNIDVACNLLETSGRFLYRFPDTALRMGNMLDIIMRLKNVKNLDARHSTLVENAYYQCKPPERSARVSKVRPPLHQVGVFCVILPIYDDSCGISACTDVANFLGSTFGSCCLQILIKHQLSGSCGS